MGRGNAGLKRRALELDKLRVALGGRQGVDGEDEAGCVGGSDVEARVRDQDVAGGERDSRRADVHEGSVIVRSSGRLAELPVLAVEVVLGVVERDAGCLGREEGAEEGVSGRSGRGGDGNVGTLQGEVGVDGGEAGGGVVDGPDRLAGPVGGAGAGGGGVDADVGSLGVGNLGNESTEQLASSRENGGVGTGIDLGLVVEGGYGGESAWQDRAYSKRHSPCPRAARASINSLAHASARASRTTSRTTTAPVRATSDCMLGSARTAVRAWKGISGAVAGCNVSGMFRPVVVNRRCVCVCLSVPPPPPHYHHRTGVWRHDGGHPVIVMGPTRPLHSQLTCSASSTSALSHADMAHSRPAAVSNTAATHSRELGPVAVWLLRGTLNA